LHDTVRHGWWPGAIAGLLLALGGVLTLVRHTAPHVEGMAG
jgi:hypothetical protein